MDRAATVHEDCLHMETMFWVILLLRPCSLQLWSSQVQMISTCAAAYHEREEQLHISCAAGAQLIIPCS